MTVLRSPALHMLVLGGLMFCAVVAWNGGLPNERPVVEIPRSRLGGMVDLFREEQGRSPSVAELNLLVDALIDQEVLFRYALELGIQHDPTAQRRLAQIAQFVDKNPHETLSPQEGARRAMDLGLHESDVVVRRILADGARRLIRSVVLTRVPSAEALEIYRSEHADQFMRPPTTRITQVMVNALAHGAESEMRTQALKQEIEANAITPAQAVALGDEAFVPASLPLLTDKDIERHFGNHFVTALSAVPEDTWSGSLRSRYGYHVVFVHERKASYLPPLDDIEVAVRQQMLQDVADKWLAYRLKQLRAEYDIVIPDLSS